MTKKKIKFLVDCIDNTSGEHYPREVDVTIDFGFEIDEEDEIVLVRDFKKVFKGFYKWRSFDVCHITTEDELEELIFQEELSRE